MDKFIFQLQSDADIRYSAGYVVKFDDVYIIGYEQMGAREMFSIGQPVYDEDNNIMGWLGIGLYSNLNYSDERVRVPAEYWQICLPTEHCKEGKKVFTYWQMRGEQK